MKKPEELKVKIFADGADRAGILEMYRNPLIKGFTTNPTLMRKAGVADYRAFALDMVREIKDRPISFEVFADEFDEMERQALEISRWAENVFVKVPITNTRREPSDRLVRRLSSMGVKLNVTALMTVEQVERIAPCLADAPAACISLFAGRIADTGTDPVPLVMDAVRILRKYPNLELIWASPREILNIYHADNAGCHIITVTNDLLKKLPLIGYDLTEYSLDTVKLFYDDGRKAGYSF